VLVQQAAWRDIPPETAYEVLALRVAVFVVEQSCAYLELDGRDLEPTARHLWIELDGQVAAYLRVLEEGDGAHRIGRVVTRAQARQRGLAETLILAAQREATSAMVLDAQSHLAAWYRRFGFERSGADFVEDGIPHTPMRWPAPTPLGR